MNDPLVLGILNVLIRISEAGQAAKKERVIFGSEIGRNLCIFDDEGKKRSPFPRSRWGHSHSGIAAVLNEVSGYLHVRVHLRQSRARGAKVSS